MPELHPVLDVVTGTRVALSCGESLQEFEVFHPRVLTAFQLHLGLLQPGSRWRSFSGGWNAVRLPPSEFQTVSMWLGEPARALALGELGEGGTPLHDSEYGSTPIRAPTQQPPAFLTQLLHCYVFQHPRSEVHTIFDIPLGTRA